jgi:hypothetical protein
MEKKGVPSNKKPNRSTGARLGTKGIVARALLKQGFSHRTVRKATGISLGSSVALKRNNVIPAAHVEAVKRHLQGKFALVAFECLESIDEGKLKEARVGELVRAAATATERAGLSGPSDRELHLAVLATYEIERVPSREENTSTAPSADPQA